MRALIWAAICAAILLGATSRSASAETILLESHVEARASSAGEALAPLFDELAKRKVKRNYEDVGQRFEARSSAPSVASAGLPSDFVEQVEKGYQLWIRGQFQPAIAALQQLVEAAHRNAGLVAANARFSAAVFKALVAISLCHQRLGNDTAAWATMAELLRSFDAEVSKGQFGVEANELFRRVRDEAKIRGAASLTVMSSDESAVLFLNERFLKVGESTRNDLIPGRYRIMAQLGKRQGRVHLVELKAGDSVRLEVEPAFESSVVTSPEWSGFVFRDLVEREQREVELAARFGTAVEALGVIVIGLDIKNERSVVYGALINPATGKELRRGSVVIDTSPQPARLRALARFLTGDKPDESVKVYESPKVVAKPRPSSGTQDTPYREVSSSSSSPWKWIAAGGAVAGVGAGMTLLLLDGTCTSDPPERMKCPDLRDFRTSGYVTLSAGVALGALATLLWLEDRSSKSREASLWIAPATDGGMAGLSMPLW
jgi:hypothetical protein